MKKFTERNGQLNLSEINREMLEAWEAASLFEQSMEVRRGAPSFVFYEGPPSANGMPGIHHVMARTIKDIFCRYKTMRGYQVKRKAGWDTHGLPVELGVEKSLGITKEDIGKKISVDDYNAACRREVMKYTKEWAIGWTSIILISPTTPSIWRLSGGSWRASTIRAIYIRAIPSSLIRRPPAPVSHPMSSTSQAAIAM